MGACFSKFTLDISCSVFLSLRVSHEVTPHVTAFVAACFTARKTETFNSSVEVRTKLRWRRTAALLVGYINTGWSGEHMTRVCMARSL